MTCCSGFLVLGGKTLRFEILDPLQAHHHGEPPVRLPAGRAQAVLGLLCLHVGQVVAKDRLIDTAWNGSPPASAATRLHSIISELRRVLPAVAYYEKGLAIAEASGSLSYFSGILGNAANAYRDMGAYRKALDAYARTIAANEAVGDQHAAAQARTGMGETLRRLGLLSESVEQHQLALAQQRELGSGHRELLTALDMLAQAYASPGEGAGLLGGGCRTRRGCRRPADRRVPRPARRPWGAARRGSAARE